MRLFVGLDIAEEIRQQIVRFAEAMREAAPDARWVKPETLHVTLKFIGETDQEQAIAEALRSVRRAGPQLRFCGAGFFPNPRSARVFWVGIEADERLGQLAAAIDEGVATLGVAREKQPYKPHLTLARAGAESSGNPNQRTRSGGTKFASVQKRLQAIPAPAFGTMLAREFFLYESKLSPAGARYTKIERFPLEA